VFAFVLGLFNPAGRVLSFAKPSEEEERKQVISLSVFYRYHGRAVLVFRWAYKPCFRSILFSFIDIY